MMKDMMEKEQEIEIKKPEYVEEIKSLIENCIDYDELKDLLDDYHENDIAEALELLESHDRKKLYLALGNEQMSEIISYVDDAEEYLREMGKEMAADVIEEMDADDAADIFEDMEEQHRDSILELVDEKVKSDIEMIQSYSEDEIGSELTTNFVTIRRGISIKEAMRSLVKQAADKDNIETLYVVENEKLYGAIELKDLIVAREHQDLEDITATSYPFVYATDKISDCINKIKDYAEDSIPVVDEEMKLIGIITAQDLIEVVDDEMGEDYAKFAGLSAEEDLEESLKDSLKKRTPWLIVLLFLGLIVSTVVGAFEGLVSEITLIASFQSVILGMSGNVGTQSLAVTIRVLTDESLTFTEKLKFIGKEVRIGFVNGILLGGIACLVVGSYIVLFRHRTIVFAFAISACVGLALVVAMAISSFMGSIIPIIFNQFKKDPAVASGPLISTVNDLVAVVTYYGLSWLILISILNLAG